MRRNTLIDYCDARRPARTHHPGGLQPREDRLEIGGSCRHGRRLRSFHRAPSRQRARPRRRVRASRSSMKTGIGKKPLARTQRKRIGSFWRNTRTGSGRKRRAFAWRISRSMARRRGRRSRRLTPHWPRVRRGSGASSAVCGRGNCARCSTQRPRRPTVRTTLCRRRLNLPAHRANRGAREAGNESRRIPRPSLPRATPRGRQARCRAAGHAGQRIRQSSWAPSAPRTPH